MDIVLTHGYDLNTHLVQLLQLFLTLLWGSILIGEVVTLDVWIFASLVALTVYIGRKLA